MSDGKVTELAPARSRAPSRAIRRRDERVRRVVRKIKKHAVWLDAPHFSSLLYAYGVLFVRFVDLHAVKSEPVDDLGRPDATTDQLVRIAGRLGQLAAQLGLSPSAERALGHDAALEVSHRKWLALADAKDGEVVPAPAAPSTRRPLPRTARPPSALLSESKKAAERPRPHSRPVCKVARRKRNHEFVLMRLLGAQGNTADSRQAEPGAPCRSEGPVGGQDWQEHLESMKHRNTQKA